MISQKVARTNGILITTADFDRLRGLLRSERRQMQAPFLEALQNELDRSTVVSTEAVPKGVVTMHSRVRVRDLMQGETDIYTLVYPDQADINENKLSVLAPLGMALLGTRAGQIVKFDAPAGRRRLKIEKILYQPEASRDFHL